MNEEEKTNGIKYFSFFRSYHEVLQELDQKEAGTLVQGMTAYVFDDVEPDFKSKNLKTIWALIKPNLCLSKKRSKAGQNKIKTISNQNQNRIKTKSN